MAQVQLTTDTKNFQISQLTSQITTVPNRIPTTTQPANATGSVIIGSSLNYLKVKVVADTAIIVNTITVTGWSYMSSQGIYIPQTLCAVQCTPSTASQSNLLYPGAADSTVFETATYVKSIGDAKVYNAPATDSNGGFFLVDLLGCAYIEFHGSSASGTAQVIWLLTSGL
jgi:hypothetical protein